MYNFVDTFNTVQRFRRGFLYTLTETDEPTFLTFSIDFNFETPTVDEFFGLYESPLFLMGEGNTYSAYNYLKARGNVAEAARLEEFKRLLLFTVQSQPWFFQSIAGLDKIWKNASIMDNPYKGKDIILEIETLESLDLRIGYLADLYRHIVNDTLYMRELVPMNLRKFSMDIYLAEFRNLRSLTQSAVFYNTLVYNNKRYANLAQSALELIRAGSDYFINNASFFKFALKFCEFDFSETLAGGGSYNIHDPSMTTNKFKIKSDFFMEESQYSNYQIKTEEYVSKYIQETENMWSQNKPITMDGVLSSIGTVYNMAQGLGALGPDLTLDKNAFKF